MIKRVYTQCFPAVNAVIEEDGKFLLVQQNKPAFRGKWSFPGGWIELEKDDPISAIKREVKEETGLDFNPESVIGIFSTENYLYVEILNSVSHSIRILFAGTVEGNLDPKLKNEIKEAKWFSFDEMKTLDWRTPSDIEIIKTFLGGEKYPLSIIHHYVHK